MARAAVAGGGAGPAAWRIPGYKHPARGQGPGPGTRGGGGGRNARDRPRPRARPPRGAARRPRPPAGGRGPVPPSLLPCPPSPRPPGRTSSRGRTRPGSSRPDPRAGGPSGRGSSWNAGNWQGDHGRRSCQRLATARGWEWEQKSLRRGASRARFYPAVASLQTSLSPQWPPGTGAQVKAAPEGRGFSPPSRAGSWLSPQSLAPGHPPPGHPINSEEKTGQLLSRRAVGVHS